MPIPAYITVGARDTQTPPGPNAAFAAAHIPHAQLAIIPGPVDHEIFVNECNDEGRDEFPEACIDAAGVDRALIHEAVGRAAVKFFYYSFTGADLKVGRVHLLQFPYDRLCGGLCSAQIVSLRCQGGAAPARPLLS